MRCRIAVLSLALAACTSLHAGDDALTLLQAARIHTQDPARPTVQAMVWDARGAIVATGDARALQAQYPDARRIDAGAATVVPGLIDAHAHIVGLGQALTRADLVGTRNMAEVIERLRAFEKTLADDAWLLGGGWDQNHWPGKAFPSVADLDEAFPDRPVWLSRVDGHAAWANSAALRAAAQDPDSARWLASGQPDGGQIIRDADGKPTGVFIDLAERVVSVVVPAATQASRDDALERALAMSVRQGLTGVHDMGTSQQDFLQLRRFADEGRLPLRVSAYADGENEALAWLCANGPYQHADGRLQMRGLKLLIDGALGSRGAAMIEDYSDDPGNRGLLIVDETNYERIVRKGDACKLQVATHAIGDRGNRIVLDTYARVLGDRARSDHRWRIEHAQIVALDDIPRFAALKVTASMQPTHATSDMPWAQDRVGPVRIAGAYAWRRFAEQGVALALGSDFPVESPDPRLGLRAAVTRQDGEGRPAGGWLPDQVLTPAEALRGFTADAAWANRDEARVGRLAVGLRADFVILDADPLTIAPSALDDLVVRSTWVDGKAVYDAETEAQ